MRSPVLILPAKLLVSFFTLARLPWHWTNVLLRRFLEDPAAHDDEKVEFLQHYGAEYGYPEAPLTVDQLRSAEFSRLSGTVYLDHAGATLYSDSQIQAATKDYGSHLYGNPHSQNESSTRSTEMIESARLQVLAYFNAPPSDYACVFTSGATAGLKLIGESFPWCCNSEFEYTVENHNSVLGIREYALAAGATATAVDVDGDILLRRTSQRRLVGGCPASQKDGWSLFAMPAECNFSGVKFSLELVKLVQERKHGRGRWMVLVDAAKSAGTSPLDLSRYPADFVVISFYKMFGYPTGLGALLIRRDAAKLLNKKYFGGGTVAVSIADSDFYRKRESIEQWLEDGTVPFLSVSALSHGFSAVNRLGIAAISRHTWSLAHYTASKLQQLTHASGSSVCVVYGIHQRSQGFAEAVKSQGPVVTFNLKRADGSWVGHREVEKLAAISRIHLRTGCFCNPGACAKYLLLSNEEMQSNFEAGHVCWDDHDIMSGKPTGAVRVSFGYMSTFEDCQALLGFIRNYFVEREVEQAATHVTRSTTSLYLKSLTVYPIKSCAGFSVDRWPLSKSGLLYDREWIIADARGVALTQKRIRSMCLIKPHIDLASGKLVVQSHSMEESLEIPLDLEVSDTSLENPVEVLMCGQRAKSRAYAGIVSEWFTKALGVPCSLIRKDVDFQQACRWRQPEHIGMRTSREQEMYSFANEGQFLVVSEASVADLSSRLEPKMQLEPMQFRPNLVVSGGIPYEEDDWRELRIGDVRLPVLGGCNRCQMITIDQKSGDNDGSAEPLRTLASYRRKKGKILFGVLLGSPEHLDDEAVLTAGSLVASLTESILYP